MNNHSVNFGIRDYTDIFMKIQLHIQSNQSFQEDGWRCSVAHGQDKCSLILDQAAWEEYSIYFVTWVAEHELKRNNFKIALIVEEQLSGRKSFVKQLEPRFQPIPEQWGYALRPLKRFVLCKKFSPLDKSTLFSTVLDEFSKLMQLGRMIGETIDQFREEGTSVL